MLDIIRGVEIRAIKGTKSYLYLSDDGSQCDIKNGEYRIKAGMKELSSHIRVLYTHKKNYVFYISERILKVLLLPEKSRLNIKVEDDTLILGPLIGVFIGQSKVTHLIKGGWDSIYWQFQNWTAECGGLLYFFTLPDIDWDQLKVTAYYWNQEKVWTKCLYPLPEVIYDRCFGQGGTEKSYALRKAIANKELALKVFNQTPKITKKETYQHLINYPETKAHLPFFSPYTPENFRQLMDECQSIYIKPNNLYKGKGVMRVTKKEQNFEIEFRREQTNEIIFCKDFNSLADQLTSMLLENYEYVLQAEIQLATFLGNRFDVRVMLQKREPSLWEVSAVNARMSPVGSVITSPRSGGHALRIDEVLATSFPGSENKILEQIKSFSKVVGFKMEEKYGFLGELGIDLGIDVNGKVWLIEVNGRPLKVSFTVLRDKAIAKVIHQNPIFLGISLCGFEVMPKIKAPPDNMNGLYALKLMPQERKLLQKDWPQKKILFLNSLQMSAFMFEPGQRITLLVGFSCVKVEIRSQDMDFELNAIYLSKKAWSDLPYYHGESVSLMMVSDYQLVLQPTVGMTISDGTWKHIEKIYEMKQTALLALEKGIFFYCFCPGKIDWERSQVPAYFFNPIEESWNVKDLPFPQVLYDMATFPHDMRKRLKAKKANQVLRRDHTLQAINSKRFFGKWQTCEALSFFAETKKMIPETSLLSPSTLRYYLDNYDFIFVKSNYGSFGDEVLRVERKGDSYLCRTGGARVEEWIFSDDTALYEFIVTKLGTDAILQKGIDLAKLHDRIFDLRVLCQKNSVGHWDITAINYRIAPAGGIITNYSAGADEILVVPSDKMPYPSLSWENITCFSKKILLALEASFGLMGEIGLDVGVDSQGNLWLIEANSKPNTFDYRELTTAEVCSKVYGQPLDYARFLARRIFDTRLLY